MPCHDMCPCHVTWCIWDVDLPSTVSIVASCFQFILRDTIPNATIRTYHNFTQFMIRFFLITNLKNSIHLTSSKTKLINLNDRRRVRITSATGTPTYTKGFINHCKANASCSGVVVVKQRLALWKIYNQNHNIRQCIVFYS